MTSKSDLLVNLIDIKVFKIGEFTLKSGVSSPIYIDLRNIIAYPKVVRQISDIVRCRQLASNLQTDVICGVPYTALPIASVFSVNFNVPMIMKRKEAKAYGTKKMVEGIFSKGTRCLIIEDIVSSGSSIIETAEVLRKEGLVVTDCISVLNRLQGGVENLAKVGITLHYLFTINELFKKYCSMCDIEPSLISKVNNYLANSYIPVKQNTTTDVKTFEERETLCDQLVLKRLFGIMQKKETNLCVAVDVVSSRELLQLAEKLGPHICVLKTHIDILTDFTTDVTDSLRLLAVKYNFLILEDRKFADIGNTVLHQYSKGLYNICKWADIVTVHGIPGSGIISALQSASQDQARACLLIAEMSSQGALTDETYSNKVVEMAKQHPEFVIGFISQQKPVDSCSIISMCPGVSISAASDSLGQQYKTPEVAINNGADIIIVGRGICNSENVVETAMQYRTEAYNAYLKRCHAKL